MTKIFKATYTRNQNEAVQTFRHTPAINAVCSTTVSGSDPFEITFWSQSDLPELLVNLVLNLFKLSFPNNKPYEVCQAQKRNFTETELHYALDLLISYAISFPETNDKTLALNAGIASLESAAQEMDSFDWDRMCNEARAEVTRNDAQLSFGDDLPVT